LKKAFYFSYLTVFCDCKNVAEVGKTWQFLAILCADFVPLDVPQSRAGRGFAGFSIGQVLLQKRV
jgi:hypothetical protein